MVRIIGLTLCLFLTACGDTSDDNPPNNIALASPLENTIDSIKIDQDNFYFNLNQQVYFVENNDFETKYCLGVNSGRDGGGVTLGLNLTLLPNGHLFTTDGEIFDKDLLIKAYNDNDLKQKGNYRNGSLATPILVENRYYEGVKYSKDGDKWTTLIDDLRSIRSDTRFMEDIQFINDEDHAVALFNTYDARHYMAVFEQGQWNPVVSDTEVTRLLYVRNKLLGLSYKKISVLDTVTGATLNVFDSEDMKYISIYKNSLIFTDGIENYQFDLDSLVMNTYEVPEEVGLITSIEVSGDAIYYGTSNGIWLFKDNSFQQIFDIEKYYDTGSCFLGRQALS